MAHLGSPPRGTLSVVKPTIQSVVAGIALTCLAGCYSGTRATRGVNASWHGRSRAAIEARWGKATVAEVPGGATLTWTRVSHHVELPSVSGDLRIGAGSFDARLAATPGRVWNTATDVVATVDAAGRIVEVAGPSVWLGKGPPRDVNLRWGALFGVHAGMGALEDASRPWPSLGLYIGGMLGPRLGLVGNYAFVNGRGTDGNAMGHAWSVAVQYWPQPRLWLRAGPAMVVALDPGLVDAQLLPGVATGASLALVRGRVFVLDLRLDTIVAPGSAFGSLGVGVNVN